MRRLLLACAGALTLGASVAGANVGMPGSTLPCSGANLSGTFAVQVGSAGAGSISYTLLVRNHSSVTCLVSGIPGLRLLGKTKNKLPTHVSPSHPGAMTAVRVDLKPGTYASATARFSPDIPGVSEPQTRQCEPTAYYLRVSPVGGGSLLAPIKPHTPVCEQGSMLLSVLVAGKKPPVS